MVGADATLLQPADDHQGRERLQMGYNVRPSWILRLPHDLHAARFKRHSNTEEFRWQRFGIRVASNQRSVKLRSAYFLHFLEWIINSSSVQAGINKLRI